MNDNQPNTYTQTKNLLCDWTDKTNYLIHYRMLNFFVTYGMLDDKVDEVFSCRQSECLEKFIVFNRQKRNKAKKEFEKSCYKSLNKIFYGETMEHVRNPIKKEFIKKADNEKIMKQQ